MTDFLRLFFPAGNLFPVALALLGATALSSCSGLRNLRNNLGSSGAADEAPDNGGTAAEGIPSQDGATPAAPANESTQAVDIANPKDVGPGSKKEGKGRMNLSIADAPIADSARQLFLNITHLELVRKHRQPGERPLEEDIVRFPYSGVEPIDLLKLRDGVKKDLFSNLHVPAGVIAEVRLVLKESAPAVIVYADGSQESIAIPRIELFEGGKGESTQSPVLAAPSPFKLAENGVVNLLFHVDVRRNVRPLTPDLPYPWFSQLATRPQFYLAPQGDLIDLDRAGNLKFVGLDADVATVCLYRSSVQSSPAAASVRDTNALCLGAAAARPVVAGNSYFAYLPEGRYEARFFKSESTFIDSAAAFDLAAGSTLEVNLLDQLLKLGTDPLK